MILVTPERKTGIRETPVFIKPPAVLQLTTGNVLVVIKPPGVVTVTVRTPEGVASVHAGVIVASSLMFTVQVAVPAA